MLGLPARWRVSFAHRKNRLESSRLCRVEFRRDIGDECNFSRRKIQRRRDFSVTCRFLFSADIGIEIIGDEGR